MEPRLKSVERSGIILCFMNSGVGPNCRNATIERRSQGVPWSFRLLVAVAFSLAGDRVKLLFTW